MSSKCEDGGARGVVMASKGGRRFGLWRLAYSSVSLARERFEYVCCWQIFMDYLKSKRMFG